MTLSSTILRVIKFREIAQRFPLFNSVLLYVHKEEAVRLQNMLVHKDIKGYPNREGVFTKDIEPTKKDMILTKRLLRAYKKAIIDEKGEKNISKRDIWSSLGDMNHAKFIDLLESEDIYSIAFSLCNMSRMGITHGITQGEEEYKKITYNTAYRHWLDRFNLDKLITLAEALGVLQYEDPEQGEYGSAIFSDIDEIVAKIEHFLQIKIIPPNIEGGQYKMITQKGGIYNRDITALYTAWRCNELLKDVRKPRICEIGAGVGKTAYYTKLLGVHSYTIIDLPRVNVLQGFYLAKCLPSVNIYFYGEKINHNENFISILPGFSLKSFTGKKFDLTLNQDSFPEIERKTVLEYLSQIALHTKYFFLSINQESQNSMITGTIKQNVVSKLVGSIKYFKQIYRFPYWLRVGYVEELYRILKN